MISKFSIKFSIKFIMTLLCFVLFFSSCSEDDSVETCEEIPIDQYCTSGNTNNSLNLNGEWKGTTSQNKDISFFVTNNSISTLTYEVCKVEGDYVITEKLVIPFEPPEEITNNHIEAFSGAKIFFCSDEIASGIINITSGKNIIFNASKTNEI